MTPPRVQLRSLLALATVALLLSACASSEPSASSQATSSPSLGTSTPATSAPAGNNPESESSPSTSAPASSTEAEPETNGAATNRYDGQALADLIHVDTIGEWPDEFTIEFEDYTYDQFPGNDVLPWITSVTQGSGGECERLMNEILALDVVETQFAGPYSRGEFYPLWALARMESPEAADAVIVLIESATDACIAEYPIEQHLGEPEHDAPFLFTTLENDDFRGASGYRHGSNIDALAFTLFTACDELIVWAAAPDIRVMRATPAIWEAQLAQIGCTP
ncbi:hypothetical protein [Humidisolicoccus flavus]|uniref:hypothetical protein n=1 Tax=Humidisolicoccus flavus TaxID=3111414 RepID=UPI0032563815